MWIIETWIHRLSWGSYTTWEAFLIQILDTCTRGLFSRIAEKTTPVHGCLNRTLREDSYRVTNFVRILT